MKVTNAGREVSTWDQPMVRETGTPGVIVLVKKGGEDFYLVRTLAEPGTDRLGCLLLGPTLQASEANLTQVHGGTRPPRAEILNTHAPDWVQLHQDGGRCFRKVNKHAVVEVWKEEIVLRNNERWFTRAELAEAIRVGEANEHLVQVFCLAIM